MNELPKMYSQIILSDGREGIVVDYMGDSLLVDTKDAQGDFVTVEVICDGGKYYVCNEDGAVYTLCHRKEIRLHISSDEVYTFLLGDKFEGEYFSLTKQQHTWMCRLLEIDEADYIKSWSHHFEYNNLIGFLNAYRMIKANGFYYAYGYDDIEKTADALYRFESGIFERYFPKEDAWREMPEQRMILEEKKHKFTVVTKEEGLSLALL